MRRSIVLGVLTAWLAVVTGAMYGLHAYSNTDAPIIAAPTNWPSDTIINRDVSHSTLVMFLHPRCPCSEASVGELDELVTLHPELAVRLVFVQPEYSPSTWSRGTLRDAAERIRGVQIVDDLDAQESHRFHAATSGETLLYDQDGTLMFQGGITVARGHFGDSPGRDLVQSHLRCCCHGGAPTEPTTAKVFGCALDRS